MAPLPSVPYAVRGSLGVLIWMSWLTVLLWVLLVSAGYLLTRFWPAGMV